MKTRTRSRDELFPTQLGKDNDDGNSSLSPPCDREEIIPNDAALGWETYIRSECCPKKENVEETDVVVIILHSSDMHLASEDEGVETMLSCARSFLEAEKHGRKYGGIQRRLHFLYKIQNNLSEKAFRSLMKGTIYVLKDALEYPDKDLKTFKPCDLGEEGKLYSFAMYRCAVLCGLDGKKEEFLSSGNEEMQKEDGENGGFSKSAEIDVLEFGEEMMDWKWWEESCAVITYNGTMSIGGTYNERYDRECGSLDDVSLISVADFMNRASLERLLYPKKGSENRALADRQKILYQCQKAKREGKLIFETDRIPVILAKSGFRVSESDYREIIESSIHRKYLRTQWELGTIHFTEEGKTGALAPSLAALNGTRIRSVTKEDAKTPEKVTEVSVSRVFTNKMIALCNFLLYACVFFATSHQSKERRSVWPCVLSYSITYWTQSFLPSGSRSRDGENDERLSEIKAQEKKRFLKVSHEHAMHVLSVNVRNKEESRFFGFSGDLEKLRSDNSRRFGSLSREAEREIEGLALSNKAMIEYKYPRLRETLGSLGGETLSTSKMIVEVSELFNASFSSLRSRKDSLFPPFFYFVYCYSFIYDLLATFVFESVVGRKEGAALIVFAARLCYVSTLICYYSRLRKIMKFLKPPSSGEEKSFVEEKSLWIIENFASFFAFGLAAFVSFVSFPLMRLMALVLRTYDAMVEKTESIRRGSSGSKTSRKSGESQTADEKEDKWVRRRPGRCEICTSKAETT